jgi:hypothetical protein
MQSDQQLIRKNYLVAGVVSLVSLVSFFSFFLPFLPSVVFSDLVVVSDFADVLSAGAPASAAKTLVFRAKPSTATRAAANVAFCMILSPSGI